MNLLDNLNPPQRAAVTHTDGPLLIFAGAGSGKTRTLTHRIAYLIREQGVPAARILAVTFTNKAAREMRERLETLVGPEARRIWMGTFHAMCARMLRLHGERIGIDPRFVIFDADDSLRLMKDVLREADVDSDRYPPARVLNRISAAKNDLRSPDDLQSSAASPYNRLIARLYEKYQERLKAAHALDFDDILSEAVRLLKESEESRQYWSERFLHVMIDEFQDVNAAQFQWAQMIAAKHRNICVVGDDDQCIVPGTPVRTPQGEVAIEKIAAGERVLGGAGRGTTASAPVQKTRTREYSGKLLRVTTRGGRTLRLTPNHMCFARLGVRDDVHYVYLMYRHDKGYRIGIVVGARSDGRRPEPQIGLRVRVNQEHADKAWILRVCTSREEAAYYEQLYSFDYGIPTTVFHVAGRGSISFTQSDIDRLFEKIDTRRRAAQLMEELGLDPEHPHYRPSGVYGTELPHRITVHLTAFGSSPPSLQAPWFRHRVWLNTTGQVLEEQVQHNGIATRPGQRGTRRVERSYKEMDRTALLAERLSEAAGGAEIARWATLTTGLKFAFQPAAHLRPTMIVPVWQNGKIVDDEIVTVEEEEYSGPVHDLDVLHLHNYIAGGIVVHNSIYAWRGANVQIILDFEKEYSDATVIRLEQNYRSTQKILDAAHGVISQNIGRKPKRLWTEAEGGSTLVLHGALNAQEEALWVVRQIEMLRRSEGRRLSDFAVLCRINAQSRPFEEAFLRARLPLRLVGTQRFYERKEIKDLVGYLKVLYNPRDDVALNRIINVPARGIGARTIEKLQLLAAENGCALWDVLMNPSLEAALGRAVAAKIEPLRALLETLQHDAQNSRTVAGLLDAVIRRTYYWDHLEAEKSTSSVDRAANVEQLIASAEEFDMRRDEEAELRRELSAALHEEYSDEEYAADDELRLGEFLETAALEDRSDANNAKGVNATGAEGENEAVTLMTLHAAKGLEFPVVFLVGMEQGLLPHARAIYGESAGADDLEEERRLCYVGLTRAQERVFLTHAAQRTLHGRTESTQPSQFLDEMPDQLLERSGLAKTGSVSSWSTSWSTSQNTSWNTSRGDERSTPAAPPQSTYKVGDRVRHATYGEGLVASVRHAGRAGEMVEIAFLSGEIGKKTLAVSYAPLEKI